MNMFSHKQLYSRMSAAAAVMLCGGVFSQQAAAVVCPPADPPPCVNTGDITDGQVTNPDIAANSVGTGKIANGAVTTAKIANGAVGSAQVTDASLTAADLAPNSVATSELVDNSIGGPDLAESIFLGGIADVDDDGELFLRDFPIGATPGPVTISLDGDTANATQELTGNGFVKAWAEINTDGTVRLEGGVPQCFRCNTSAAETRSLGAGTYEVGFLLPGADISRRPRSASLDGHTTLSAVLGEISMGDRSGDATSVFVLTANSDGTLANKPFTILIY